jgi:putative ABC transport system permease protein
MRLSTIALRNVRRHLSRSALLVIAISVTTCVVVTLFLVTKSAEQDLSRKVDQYGANIVVVPRSSDLPLVYGGVQVGGVTYDVEPLSAEDESKIRGIEARDNLSTIAPKLVERGEVNGEQALVVGVRWPDELAIKRWWEVVGERPSAADHALLGSRAAERLGISAGEDVEIEGETFRVTGVLGSTGTQEDELVYIDLATAQRLWDRPGELSLIEVAAYCSTCPIETINAQISAEIPNARVSALLKAAASREILVGQFRLFSLVLSVLMILVGCLIVLTTTLGSVRDRRGEIGIFRSIGYRRRHIVRIILLENMTLAFAGAIVGVAAAVLLYGPVARSVAGVTDTTTLPGMFDLAGALVVALGVVLVASLYPARRAAALSPTLAMRRV